MPVVPRSRKQKKSKLTRLAVVFSVVIVLFLAELFFDFFEITIGRVLLITNPIRPQVGRLWEEDQKEQKGIEELGANSATSEEVAGGPLQSLDDLQAILSIRSSLSMTREEFKEFYKSIPIKQARQLLDPLDLIALDRALDWQTTQLSLSGNQLVAYFLDGYEQPIKQTHFIIGDNGETANEQDEISLDQDETFENRVVSAANFYQAFDKLPRSFRLQIVNDPYKLVRWGASLREVGISRFVEDDGVEVVFVVAGDAGLQRHSMFASPIAIEYLLKEINEISDAPKLTLPVRKNEPIKEEN